MSTAITDRTFGIELEITVPRRVTSAALCDELAAAGVTCRPEQYGHSTPRNWKLVSDGSIRGGTHSWAIELVSPVLRGEQGIEEVRKVCVVLTRLGVSANRSCGFHVHHGARDFKTRHFEHLFALYRNSEKAIDALMPESRRASTNHFSKSLKTKSVSLLMSDRYHKLNLGAFSRHGTVEFRHHAGTVNPDKVVSWVIFTQRMVERAKRKVNSHDHDYTWYDVKQLLGLVHTEAEELKALATFYDLRRQALAARPEREVGPAARLTRAAAIAAGVENTAQSLAAATRAAAIAAGVENTAQSLAAATRASIRIRADGAFAGSILGAPVS